MTLNQILYFQTVARHQHFRLAAAELSISQPSLSRSIAALEEELGIILFERKGRTVTLTKYGKLFLEHADRILDEVRLAQKHMKKLSGNAGHVDIGYVFPLAAHYIPHTVRRFLSTQKNKDVTFNFHQSGFFLLSQHMLYRSLNFRPLIRHQSAAVPILRNFAASRFRLPLRHNLPHYKPA